MRLIDTFLILIFFVLIHLITACATQRVSTIVGCNYNDKKNQTDYFVFPYGSVSIPDKWEKSNYNSVSRQQFLKNKDSITMAIAFGLCNKFEFNANGNKTGFDFVKLYYEWDSKYYVDSHGLNREIIEKDSIDSYMIWRLYGTYQNDKIDNYFLFGAKNCTVSNFMILNTDKWTKAKKLDFLKVLYKKRN